MTFESDNSATITAEPTEQVEQATVNNLDTQVRPNAETITAEPEAQAVKYAGKYDSTEALEEAYISLEKKFSSTRPADVPETYEINLSDELIEKNIQINAEDPMLESFKGYAKENKLSQDQFNSVVNYYINSQATTSEKLINEMQAESEAVLKEVGITTTPEIARKELKTWLMNNSSTAYEKDIEAVLLDPSALKVISTLKSKASLGIPNPAAELKVHGEEYFIKQKSDTRYLTEKWFTEKVDSELLEAVRKGWL